MNRPGQDVKRSDNFPLMLRGCAQNQDKQKTKDK
jgi:hypothetical protein